MLSGVHRLIDGSLIHQLRFETISNNLANSNTTGFKKDIISFDQALTMKYMSHVDLTAGPIRHTGNQLDVALESKGFFKVQTPRGIRYTRDGAFALNKDGKLTTQSGYPVLGDSGPIQINGNKVEIMPDGKVAVDGATAGKISVVDFDQPHLLRKEDRSLLTYQGEEGGVIPSVDIRIKHKFIEGANVDLTKEMINMIEAFRAFESAQKAIQAIDEMTRKMVNDTGMLN